MLNISVGETIAGFENLVFHKKNYARFIKKKIKIDGPNFF